MKGQFTPDTARFGWRKRFIESRISMRVEIVLNSVDTVHVGIGFINQPAHLLGEMQPRS